MRQKRILALLLALVMLLGLAACGKKSSDEDTGQKEKDYEVMDPAELVGAWRMVAWSLTDDTSYTKVEDSYMVFSASDLKYYSAGALMTDSNYTFADEESILLVAKNDPNNKVGWVIHKTGENTAVIIDNMNGIKYYIEKDPTIDLSQLAVNAITPEELAGTWRMYQTVSNGKTTPVYGAYMVFTESNMSYFVNGLMKTDNKYVFTGERTIKLTSKIASGSVSWGIYTNGDGELICTDPSGISYHCVRDNGLKSVSLSQLQGTYELYAWSMIDGTEYTAMTGNYCQFKNDVMKYYVNGIMTSDSTVSRQSTYNWLLRSNTGSDSNIWVITDMGDHLVVTDTSIYVCYYLKKVADIDFDTPQASSIDPADLVGEWKVVKWASPDGNTYDGNTVVHSWVIGKGTMDYYYNGALATSNTFELSGDYLILKSSAGSVACGISINKNGQMILDCTSWGYGVMTCEKVEDETPITPPDPPKEDPIPVEDLPGNWKVVSWKAPDGNTYDGAAVNHSWKITGTAMDYYFNDVLTTANTYTVKDNIITLTSPSGSVTCKASMDDEGRLILDCTSWNYGVMICEKQPDYDISGQWKVTSWEAPDGNIYDGSAVNHGWNITDSTMDYYYNGVLTSANTYTMRGSVVSLTAVGGTTAVETPVSMPDANTLIIDATAWGYGIMTCTRVEEPIEPEELEGTWDINFVAPTVDGPKTPVTNAQFRFTATDMTYFVDGAVVADNTYTITADGLVLTDKASGATATWPVSLSDDGTLVIDGGAAGVFFCTKHSLIQASDLNGTWTVTHTAPSADGEKTPASGTELVFADGTLYRMVNGAAVSVSTYTLTDAGLDLGNGVIYPLQLDEDGHLTMDAAGAGDVVYYAEKVTTAPTSDQLSGTWIVGSWLDNTLTPVDISGHTYGWVIDGTSMSFYDGTTLLAYNTYTLYGKYMVMLPYGSTTPIITGVDLTDGILTVNCYNWNYGIMYAGLYTTV